jgi:hypothetical protein
MVNTVADRVIALMVVDGAAKCGLRIGALRGVENANMV